MCVVLLLFLRSNNRVFPSSTVLKESVCLCADDEQNEPKTHLELMAEMRDYKRRRQSYRAKNVHITKKSYTEASNLLRLQCGS